MDINYSVIIRTTGKAKEKYQGLLHSISILEPQPKEIIVVLPEGFDLPEEKLGWETFYFSEKGMFPQRITGLNLCKTEYALVCDDDVVFENDFVKQLYEPISKGFCGTSIAPLYSFLPPKGFKSFVSSIMAGAVPTKFNKNKYNTVLRSTGYSYNRNLNKETEYYETESAPGTCFFTKVSEYQKIGFEAEKWLEAKKYAAIEDQTMFYKAWLRGIKTMVVTKARYEHLDGKTSTRNNKDNVIYASNFNRTVFWHRFIYKQQKNFLLKIWSIICYVYYVSFSVFYDFIGLIRRRITFKNIKTKVKGIIEGFKYTKSSEYKNLPSVKG